MAFIPAYKRLRETGNRLATVAAQLYAMLEDCRLCPRRCRVNRLKGETGVCGTTYQLKVSSAFPHFGEEPPLVGHCGSGTIFLTSCNLGCVFCQNYDISHGGIGEETTPEELADVMLALQGRGCHNINFVTPTHYAPQIVQAVDIAAGRGLEVPLVWNCGGYESMEVIRLLDGIVDIYMPDIKFFSPDLAERYCDAPDYPAVVKEVIKEMHRQVGELAMDSRGIARRGLLVRHLVMPGDAKGSEAIMRFIADEVSRDTYVNVMDQYHPAYHAANFPEINRRITQEEYRTALKAATDAGLRRGFEPVDG